jgi:hypothetical protein
MGAGKPVPTVPSDQGIYQLLWDALDRSNRSLKQTAPSQANKSSATQLPTKKAEASSSMPKASSSMPILPEPPSNCPLSPSPPESFEGAKGMVEEAWKVAFPSLQFPVEFIGVFPQEAKKGVRDIKLGNGLVVLDVPNRYNLVAGSDLACFRRERGLVTALKKIRQKGILYLKYED